MCRCLRVARSPRKTRSWSNFKQTERRWAWIPNTATRTLTGVWSRPKTQNAGSDHADLRARRLDNHVACYCDRNGDTDTAASKQPSHWQLALFPPVLISPSRTYTTNLLQARDEGASPHCLPGCSGNGCMRVRPSVTDEKHAVC